MLHPRKNRIDYGEQLIPPGGFTLERAIGTTYSLELEALMVLPVALFYSQALDGNPDELRYDMLDAITQAANKVTVYYQNGQLKVPHKYHALMAYWEKGIVPINMQSYVNSFHPKVWVIRYECKGKPACYRVLVTSRNLTFAHDWDVAFSTDGTVSGTEQPRNKPLIHFLQHLDSLTDKKIDPKFISELLYVKFDTPEKFDSLRFVPVGVSYPDPKKKYVNPLTSGKNTWNDLLIVSPFLDAPTLKKLSEAASGNCFLLSSKMELDSIPENVLEDFEVWQFSTFIENAARMQELAEEEQVNRDQGLHAKLFVTQAEDNTSWHLGSANCTDPAQGRNVEFMVELSGIGYDGRPRSIFNALTDPKKMDGVVLFTPYDVNARESTEELRRVELEIRKIKYELSGLSMQGSVTKVEGGTAYNLTILIDARKMKWPDVYTITVKPLPETQKQGVALLPLKENKVNDFTGYTETQLSPFLLVEILHKGIPQSRFLLSMEIELPDSRLHRIFTSIIDSREKFLKYLTFLLTGEETDMILSTRGDGGDTSNVGDALASSGIPVFEKLLIAASRSPGKLRSIDTLIQRLKAERLADEEPIISPEFEGFWHVFQNYLESTKS